MKSRMRRVSLWMFLQFGDLLEDRRGRLCLDRILTTGPPQEEAGRYYSEKLLKPSRSKVSENMGMFKT